MSASASTEVGCGHEFVHGCLATRTKLRLQKYSFERYVQPTLFQNEAPSRYCSGSLGLEVSSTGTSQVLLESGDKRDMRTVPFSYSIP